MEDKQGVKLKKLITIAIPTYNRGSYLDVCLAHICKQIKGLDDLVEIIVSDNNSSDNTHEVVHKYIEQGFEIYYVNNDSNIGMDNNFVQCYKLASSKYVLLFGDDDVLLDGALEKIINVLKNGNYGVVYINPYEFKDNYLLERPALEKNGVVIYSDHEAYVTRINYMFTFISSNIVNKSLVVNDLSHLEFIGSKLIQLNWILSAMFKADNNAFIENFMVAAKSGNTGGYQLCQVFGININKIFEYFVTKGVNRKYFDIINVNLIKSFFPHFLLLTKSRSSSYEFQEENYFNTLQPVFKKYVLFWIVLVPIVYLPYKAGSIWFKLYGKFMQISNIISIKS